jgi:hypothetical protein
MKLALYTLCLCVVMPACVRRETVSTTAISSSNAPLLPDEDQEDETASPSTTLAGTLRGTPFKARAALAGKNPDGSIWVDIFEADVPCERRATARATRVTLSTAWPEGKSADAPPRFVVYDSAGSSIAKPFSSAKTTFGKRPTKDAPGSLELRAASDDGTVDGAVTVRWCD